MLRILNLSLIYGIVLEIKTLTYSAHVGPTGSNLACNIVQSSFPHFPLLKVSCLSVW